ncbi:hypothetical protein BKA66DRAFT_512601 [Pyrenochaeta sp. MPI-SDFR-AT-0127]|nr:hypothetical protein BKA66DRAFT_512601 [Pyrenochaeta sp. MPI-SDFR-AT-0127]
MEPATAGLLYATENLLQGAAALVKGITHPTLPVKANLTRVTSVPLSRSQHTISVVKGRAYIFGGDVQPGQLADNAMHVVILPSSGVLEADYTTFPARAANGFGDVPSPRKGHSAVVIGDSIYIFGGENESVMNEKGRVWVYHTVSNAWSYLDPASDMLYPSPRTGHMSAGSDLPSPKAITYCEKSPQAPADPAKVVPEPAKPDSWGTIFVVGGRNTLREELLSDALAFDIRSRTWSNIPSPSGTPRDGASLSIVGDRLYRFGGKGVETFTTGATEYLDVSYVWKHAEGGTTPLTSGWAWGEVPHNDSKGTSAAAPQARSNAGLVGVTTGQGRHYLLVIGGEAENDAVLLDDMWALQLPPEHSTAAAVKDNIRASIKKDTHESKWSEVLYRYMDTKGEEEEEIPGEPKRGLGTRGQFGIAKGTEVDEGRVLSDGWMVTIER